MEQFAIRMIPSLRLTPFHRSYYRMLDAFARGGPRHMMVSVPPQHGKSLGASQLLPAFILGLFPDTRIAIASYNSTLASRFNKRVQRLMAQPAYTDLFPGTLLKETAGNGCKGYVQTSTEFDIVGRRGGLISVGREGSLTGTDVDVFILDDLYKDAMEANSPVIRENCWEWYTSVVKTRMHNDSSELIVFTRWHEEDLIGLITSREKYSMLTEWSQLESPRDDSDQWLVVNFEAIKESPPSATDQRLHGEPLWPQKHSLKVLESKRRLDVRRFECMYQGRPDNKEGLLYGEGFATYQRVPEGEKRANYTDTADLGDDYLCSVCYVKGLDGLIYVTDVLYSREGMHVTEKQTAEMLQANDTREVYVESNNGGRGFARAIGNLATGAHVKWFHQSGNKEARIKTNSSTVLKYIRMPHDWHLRWPDFSRHLTTYRREFGANRWHDAPDVLTGIIEKEVSARSKNIRLVKEKTVTFM